MTQPATAEANAAAAQTGDSHEGVVLSIIAPALNEEDNIGPLVDEVQTHVIEAGVHAELIVVDDGSTDRTLERLKEHARSRPWLRPLHRPQPRGQSAAMHAGIQAARGAYVATIDADLQNDPADLPKLLKVLQENGAQMAQGLRARRQDNAKRKFSTWVGRTTRKLLLGDTIRDTGCSTRVVDAAIAKRFPLMFKGMHRFMPIYAKMLGAEIVEVEVNHRPRVAGVAKYGMLDRAFVGLVDCFVMRWMLKRYRDPSAEEIRVKIELTDDDATQVSLPSLKGEGGSADSDATPASIRSGQGGSS